MEKERRMRVLSLCALLIAVIGLTIAFASLSQMLTINGTATVNTASWDIHFKGVEYETSGAATAKEAQTDGTAITGISATITKPEDYVAYNSSLENGGTINAKIDSIEISTLCTLSSPVESCDWDNNGTVTQTDVDKVNHNISFVLGYQMTEEDTYMRKVSVGDTLNANEAKDLSVVVYYGHVELIKDGEAIQEESTELPKRSLQFKDLSIRINFVQAD